MRPERPTDDARIAREQAFHDARFAEGMSRAAQEKYYWAVRDGRAVYEARLRALAHGADVLEYGCATGDFSRALAPGADSVAGIDISSVAIAKAEALAPPNARFAVMNAEAMEFADESFDLVFGSGIVHHLHVERSAREVCRVLRPGGTALFWEPLGHNPAFNLYRRATPEARTEDEHPLLRRDIETMERVFGAIEVRHYGLFTLGAVPFRGGRAGAALFAAARAVDRATFAVPGLRWQSWYALIEAHRSD